MDKSMKHSCMQHLNSGMAGIQIQSFCSRQVLVIAEIQAYSVPNSWQKLYIINKPASYKTLLRQHFGYKLKVSNKIWFSGELFLVAQ